MRADLITARSNQWPLMQHCLFSPYLNFTKHTRRSFSNVTVAATQRILVIKEGKFHCSQVQKCLWFSKKDLKNSKQRGSLLPQEDIIKRKRRNRLSNMKRHVEQTQNCRGLSRETWITVATCLLITGAGNSNAVFDRSCDALELHTFKILEPWLGFFRSPPRLSGHLNHHLSPHFWSEQKYPIYESRHTQQQHRSLNKALTVWSCFIATTAKQRVTSTGDPGSYMSASLHFTSLW